MRVLAWAATASGSQQSITAILAVLAVQYPGEASARRALSIDDVLGMSRVDQVALSPDKKQLAVVILRPASVGEIYGRTHYEIDPSRGDIWLMDRATGSRRQITDGRGRAAGSWCAQWSPDGTRLAFLSTSPERREPKGGDNVRLYLWEATSGVVRRLSNRAVMNQTRTGSNVWNVSFRGPRDETSRLCRTDEDNAPFVWTDSRHILVALRPNGARSGLFDEYSRALSLSGETLNQLRQGEVVTATKIGSGAERTTIAGADAVAQLALLDVESGRLSGPVDVPAYPLWGDLAVAVSPNGRRASVLASTGLNLPEPAKRVSMSYSGMIERRMGFVDLPFNGSVRWADFPATELKSWSADSLSIQIGTSDSETLLVSADTGAAVPVPAPAAAPTAQTEELPGYAMLQDKADGITIYSQATEQGLLLRERIGAATRTLLTLNDYFGQIDWGRRETFDYLGPNGQSLKAAVFLPPDWVPGTPLPTLVWVYPGTLVGADVDYFSDPSMPGFYNLRLYAARGFAVLIPSMPFDRAKSSGVSIDRLLDGVTPAIDALVARGVADPERLGVFGQSLGGFAVNGILTQTDRFKAAAAIASISDWRSFYLSIDSTARGYAGVEHERSSNMPIVEAGYRHLGKKPWEDGALYESNSPIALTDRIHTPLLLIHGEQDVRGGMSQAETMFMALWRQGKTARLLRYWGESHGLALSPANIRDIHAELIEWFDRYLRK